MAFNFNWSPLIADTDRVRDMLTTALNKSPKPPIIVDDILVNELNLGSTPPELEILEIGDLAEDRFRGIFKMSYTGDAYLTLKTRVQANPLNTFLSTRPAFTSPSPLAANSSLTIPLQITLSDIRLSGFVILVFSKQKGITLVFRNDPLESLKVSSTFDSIPFVRDYLQKTIENQLRVLFVEDLPAIIHRLSLRMFSPEHQIAEIDRLNAAAQSGQARVDPFASTVQPEVDELGMPLDGSEGFSLDPPGETYATFSQKNLLRLAALSESQRTLSLFTPSIRDTVYRAWANAGDRECSSVTDTSTYKRATLSRIQSSLGIGTFSGPPSETSDASSHATRPTLASMQSTASVYSLSSSKSRAGQRKRKNRIVNLRKNDTPKDTGDAASLSSGYEDSASASGSRSFAPSASGTQPTSELPNSHRDDEVSTPYGSPRKKVDFQPLDKNATLRAKSAHRRPFTPPSLQPPTSAYDEDNDSTPRASMILPKKEGKRPQRQGLPRMQTLPVKSSKPDLSRSLSDIKLNQLGTPFSEGSTGGILEQAWMSKMANEVAKRVAKERSKQSGWRASSDGGSNYEGDAPPAYAL